MGSATMEENKIYSIGLDIGIASVGWAVLNTRAQKIDDLGVRLFSARNSDNNLERRTSRGMRRLNSRRKTRKNDAKRFLAEHGFYEDEKLMNECPYQLRVKGLNEELSKAEIYKVILHILKKRGVSYLDDSVVEDATSGQDYKGAVESNLKLTQELTPGQIQFNRLNEDGRIRTGVNFKGEYQLNVFPVKAYANELKRILECQKDYHEEINQEFIDFFIRKEGKPEEIGLVYRKRPYYHGPGNKYNNSEYGRWANYKEDGKPAENIFDKLIGRDLQGYLRAASVSITAQKYNLLNDLNNITIDRENPKITTEEKEQILDFIINRDSSRLSYKDIFKEIGLSIEQIRGYRIDRNGKPEFHTMGAYRRWKTIFAEYDIDLNTIDDNTYNEIAKAVMLNTERDGILDTLNNSLPDLDKNILEIVLDNKDKLRRKDGNESWHSFSIKTMEILIPELINTSEEQNTILERLGIKKINRRQLQKEKTIPADIILDEIYNPTASKSVRQAIKVFNALVKKYGKENIANVVIEMPRDKNEKEEQDNIKLMNKNNEQRKKDSQAYFLEKSGWNIERFESELRRPAFAKKLYHYFEQDGKCAYSGKAIQPEMLLTNETEIDHIIPLSISLDDSLKNKVLVKAEANQEKGQRSPIQAFDEGANFGQSKEEFIAWVSQNKNFGGKGKVTKAKLLLEDRNIYDPEVRDEFIARNLNDTRYSSRIVLNAIQSFFYESGTKVKVINGNFTHTLRKKWGDNLEKTRETHYHHAVDAVLCAVSPYVKPTAYEYRETEEGRAEMVDLDTGEVMSYAEYKKLRNIDKKSYIPEWKNFREQLYPSSLYPRIKFSHQVDKKSNRKVSDATIYSTREKTSVTKNGKEKTEEFVIAKIKDIYTVDGYKEFEKNRDKLLMKELDSKTFEILCKIADTYPNYIEKQDASSKVKKVDISPFKLYCAENNILAIQKYSKRGNGPYIRSLKYYHKKIGNHINITKDNDGQKIEQTERGKKVILTTLNPWRTDVYYDAKTQSYNLLGIKYNHLKYQKGEYGIPKETYQELMEKEKIGKEQEFVFSLYRKDLIRIEQGDLFVEGLYHSRTMEHVRNYFEIKPIDKPKWDASQDIDLFGKVSPGGQFVKSLKQDMIIRKFYIDLLGNKFEVKKEEGPQNIL